MKEHAASFTTFTLGPTNCFLLKAGSGYLLIDTSFPPLFERFLAELEKAAVDPARIGQYAPEA